MIIAFKMSSSWAAWVPLWALLWASPWSHAQYLGEEELDPLQKTAFIDGNTTDLDHLSSTIYTNRTTTHLNCASGFMHIVVNFSEPFHGIIYPNGSRSSPCLTHGSGLKEYTLNLPLKGCGTTRVDRRVFMNNIMVRFHKGLELEGDEVKTIICRYPSPEVLPPPAPPVPFIATPAPTPMKQVGEVEILMIICAILFLALMLVGMACSYTCLKKRNIRIVRRRPMTIETIPSDYPSESPSSGSELEFSIPVEEERLSSVYSDHLVQNEIEVLSAQTLVKPPKPTFMVRVKKAPTPPRTPEPDYVMQNALSQSLTTILERDESYRAESLPGSERALILTESEAEEYEPPEFTLRPDTLEVERIRQEQLVFKAPPPPSEEASIARSISEHELAVDVHAPPIRHDIQRTETVTTSTKQITDIEETIERGMRRHIIPREPSEPDSDYPSEARSVTDVVEDLAVLQPPQKTTHTVDDRYLTTITQTHTSEDVEKHRRYIKQYHMKPKPLPPPKWNVAIRHYPGPKYADELESSGPEWEAYSEPGSDVFRRQMMDGVDETLSQIDVEHLEHPPPPNWTVLLRVLDPPPTEEAVRYVLTEEDRNKWRQILTTESTLRTMLTRATVREDYERIRHDTRYEKLFEPQKWDVIIRILSPPEGRPRAPGEETSSDGPTASDTDSLVSSKDGKKPKTSTSGPGKRGSLPPLYEFDSDGNPIIKKIPGPPSSRSRRSSKSSLVSGQDVRSITETEVHYSRQFDTCSDASGPSSISGGARSHADRSHSEITYAPGLPLEDYPDTDTESRASARTGRSLARSASEFTEDWRHHDRYSVSSADSKPHRQLERGTSEYMEEAPHLSDFPLTSPDHSPSPSPQIQPRFTHQSHQYDNYAYEEHQEGDPAISYGSPRYLVPADQPQVHFSTASHSSQRVSQHQSSREQYAEHEGRTVSRSQYSSSDQVRVSRVQGRGAERELAELYPLDFDDSDKDQRH